MVTASVSDVSDTLGTSKPLLVKLISSPADTSGTAPVELMPMFCAFTEENVKIVTHGGSHLWEVVIPFVEL